VDRNVFAFPEQPRQVGRSRHELCGITRRSKVRNRQRQEFNSVRGATSQFVNKTQFNRFIIIEKRHQHVDASR
jgi:hypothetical protein